MSELPTPTVDDLREIAEQVWAAYLDPEGVRPLLVGEPAEAAGGVSASVSLTGGWHGHVVVTCSAGGIAAFKKNQPARLASEGVVNAKNGLGIKFVGQLAVRG